MSVYPVRVEVTSPPAFDRIQLVLRLAIGIVLGWVGITAGLLVLVLYGALPVIAAIAVSSGPDRWQREVRGTVWSVLVWLLQLEAYMMLLVDRFPAGGDHPVRIELVHDGATPTPTSALLRLVTSLASGFVLGILWFLSAILWVIAAISVLFVRRPPASILAFQRGVLRWQARLVAYHASLVDEYPPFSFDTGETEEHATVARVS